MSKAYEPVPVPDGTPRDTDILHEVLQTHIRGCAQCREAATNTEPRGFGQKSKMCPKYFELVATFANGVEL